MRKQIIPLLVEEGYEPDEWLGALQATLRYYKIFNEDLTQTDMQDLLSTLADKATDEAEGKK